MNGMEMLFSAMGIDPKKIADDFSMLKDQVILTLKEIESKMDAIRQAQTEMQEQLQRMEASQNGRSRDSSPSSGSGSADSGGDRTGSNFSSTGSNVSGS